MIELGKFVIISGATRSMGGCCGSEVEPDEAQMPLTLSEGYRPPAVPAMSQGDSLPPRHPEGQSMAGNFNNSGLGAMQRGPENGQGGLNERSQVGGGGGGVNGGGEAGIGGGNGLLQAPVQRPSGGTSGSLGNLSNTTLTMSNASSPAPSTNDRPIRVEDPSITLARLLESTSRALIDVAPTLEQRDTGLRAQDYATALFAGQDIRIGDVDVEAATLASTVPPVPVEPAWDSIERGGPSASDVALLHSASAAASQAVASFAVSQSSQLVAGLPAPSSMAQ